MVVGGIGTVGGGIGQRYIDRPCYSKEGNAHIIQQPYLIGFERTIDKKQSGRVLLKILKTIVIINLDYFIITRSTRVIYVP